MFRDKLKLMLVAFFLIIASRGVSSNSGYGYEFLDSGQVLHMWNPKLDYYFNRTSGLQFANHYQQYWAENIMCLGWKNGGWNYKCTDGSGLGSWDWTIETDNSTYVSAEGVKNITLAGKQIEARLNYTLNTDQADLIVKPIIKNIDSTDITNDIRFVWQTRDIQIGGEEEDNLLNINFTDQLNLSESLNEVYRNPLPSELLYTNGLKWMRTRWNQNLDSIVAVKSESGQHNSPVTLLINTTGLNIGQTKSSKLLWIDADCVVEFVDTTPVEETKLINGNATHTIGGCVYKTPVCPSDPNCGNIVRIQVRGEEKALYTTIGSQAESLSWCEDGAKLTRDFTWGHNNKTDVRFGLWQRTFFGFCQTPLNPFAFVEAEDIWLNNNTPETQNVSLNATPEVNSIPWETESGSVNISVGYTDLVVPLERPVNISRAFVLIDSTQPSGDNTPDGYTFNAWLNKTSITFSRITATTDTSVSYFVVEGDIYVQNGTAIISAGTTQTSVSFNSVNLSKSIIVHNQATNSNSASDLRTVYTRGIFLNDTAANFLVGSTIPAGVGTRVSYFIVEFNNATVLNGTTAFTGAETNLRPELPESLPSLNNSWLVYSYNADTSGLSQTSVAGNIENNSALRFSKKSTTGSNEISYFVIQFGDGTTVLRGNTTEASGTAVVGITIPTINLSRANSYVTNTCNGEGTAFPRQYFIEEFNSTTELRVSRNYTGQAFDLEWQVVNYSESPASSSASLICEYAFFDLDGDEENTSNPPPYVKWYKGNFPIFELFNTLIVNDSRDLRCCVKSIDNVFETGNEKYVCSEGVIKLNILPENIIIPKVRLGFPTNDIISIFPVINNTDNELRLNESHNLSIFQGGLI